MAAAAVSAGREGKHLTFHVGDEVYAVEVGSVREIVSFTGITPVPRTPAYIRGVIDLRGRVVPVIGLREKLGHASVQPTPKTCIVIMESGAEQHQTGFVVDSVEEVLHFASADLQEPPPWLAGGVNGVPRYLSAIANVRGKLKLVLDMAQVVATPGLLDFHRSLVEAGA